MKHFSVIPGIINRSISIFRFCVVHCSALDARESTLTIAGTVDAINFFYVFYSGHVFLRFLTFFIFSTFLCLKKTLSNAKYKYVKFQRKILLEDDLAMIFIDFGLLRSLYCKISDLLAEEH